jgi:hypothetical protein
MSTFREFSSYELFAAVSPRLLNGSADTNAVSLLGKAVSDVLDNGCPDADVRLMIADLEAERANADAGEINSQWILPLTSLLGLLRQTIRNREAMAAALDPSSDALREQVLAAIDAGVSTPSAIGPHLRSPATVVSQILLQLANEGLVEPAEPADNLRQRPYRRVRATAEQRSDTQERADAEGVEDTEGRGDTAGSGEYA